MDEVLLESASIYGPVIAIGDPRDPTPPLGAARIFVPGEGNEWQHVVTSLLQACCVTVVCPSTSAGVQWELDLIRDAIDRLKIIFLANPTLSAADSVQLFRSIAPSVSFSENERPVAAYVGKDNGFRVLTTRRPLCLQSFIVALNAALQENLGAAPRNKIAFQRHRRRIRPRSA
ncbi:MAG: hypothetical protein JSS00_13690 [Proteobacteria bacterium]|nr:hypothetical protein [Pseudomonadota bacterium]